MNRSYHNIALIFGLLSLSLSGVVLAQTPCPCGGGTVMADTEISSALNGNTVCAVYGSDKWQEWHNGGNIVELGNNPAGENVGTWFVSPATDTVSAKVTYSYTGDRAYSYTMCKQDTSYHFCGESNVTGAWILTSKTPCSF